MSNQAMPEPFTKPPDASAPQAGELAAGSTSGMRDPSSAQTPATKGRVTSDAGGDETRATSSAPVQREGAAHAAVSRVKEAAAHAAHETGELLHTASEKVRTGSQYVERRAAALGGQAERAVEAGARRAARAGKASVGFVSANALPLGLSLMGVGLGMLALRAWRQRPSHRPTLTRRIPVRRELERDDEFSAPVRTVAPTVIGDDQRGVREVSDDYAI